MPKQVSVNGEEEPPLSLWVKWVRYVERYFAHTNRVCSGHVGYSALPLSKHKSCSLGVGVKFHSNSIRGPRY